MLMLILHTHFESTTNFSSIKNRSKSFERRGNHRKTPRTHSAQTAAMSFGLVTLPLKYTTRERYLGWRQRALISSLGALGAIMITHTETLLAF